MSFSQSKVEFGDMRSYSKLSVFVPGSFSDQWFKSTHTIVPETMIDFDRAPISYLLELSWNMSLGSFLQYDSKCWPQLWLFHSFKCMIGRREGIGYSSDLLIALNTNWIF